MNRVALCRGILALALCATDASAQFTQRVSLSTQGQEGNSHSGIPAISADGRFVVFKSFATNLVDGDTNGEGDLFVRDRLQGTTERVSVPQTGGQADWDSEAPQITPGGRFVVFSSRARNLVAGDTNNMEDVFVRDRVAQTTERVNLAASGAQAANGESYSPAISADGRYVAFGSQATNLSPGGTGGIAHVYVRDRQAGTTVIVSVDSNGAEADDGNWGPVISADGRYVAFLSFATNLVPGDSNATGDVFVHDRQNHATIRVSVGASGAEGDGESSWPAISADGRRIAFRSLARNLVPGDANQASDVFLRDLAAGTIERISIGASGNEGNGDSYVAFLSPDARFVTFLSQASNLVQGDANGTQDVFLRDRTLGTTERVSVAWNGAEGNEPSFTAGVSADGRYVAFQGRSENLVPGDHNGNDDVFVRDRFGGPAFASLCLPGIDGVISCPCSNPPGGPGAGCDNSSATGGSRLSASGGTLLSSDSLVFTTSGERATAFSLLLQGTAEIQHGVVYGQGVRCSGGTLRRLYAKNAVAGSIRAPDFGAGDPTVSARSATTGDVIQAGQSRWYFVAYRDPVVLGGCAVSRTFNATPSGRIDWSP